MTFLQLLLRNLRYHWRGNLAVFLGIALGSAVLSGALLVGDSLRGSLRALTLEQLGWVEEAMAPGRFFRAQLAEELPAETKCAVLLLQGSAARRGQKGEQVNRVGRVSVIGVDASFWPNELAKSETELWASDAAEVVLNESLAAALGAKVDEKIVLNLQKPGHAPGESLLGQRKAGRVTEPVQVRVRRIVPDQGMARFSLKPTPAPTRNAFVPIRLLQRKLDLAGRANAVLVARAAPTLQADLHARLTLDDWGLRYRSPEARAGALVLYLDRNNIDEEKLKPQRWGTPLFSKEDAVLARTRGERVYEQKKSSGRIEYWKSKVPDALVGVAEKNEGIISKKEIVKFYEDHRDYWVLESTRMFIEPEVVNALKRLDPPLASDADTLPRWNWNPILIYLADSISDGKNEAPYAIVAGEDFLKIDGKKSILEDDQVLVMDWPGSPLQFKPQSDVTLTYFAPNEKNELVKRGLVLKLHTHPLPKTEGVFDDPDLTPEFPGITDKLDMGSWDNPPFPYDPKRAKAADDFWKRYKTTPRAYVSLKKAQELWQSRFGNLTSIQFRKGSDHPEHLPAELLKELKPDAGGFVFQSVRQQAVEASAGATDFGVLFLSFSFFLIVAALLLVGLLVRLNIDRRAAEVGLLLATGWSHGGVRLLLLGEGALLAVLGGLVGLAGAVLYAHLMLKLLSANWPGGGSLNFLSLHAEPTSFTIGYTASVAVSVLTLVWATRVLGGLSPRALLHGQTLPETAEARGISVTGLAIGIVALLSAGLMTVIGLRSTSHALQAGMFFGSGAMLLAAALAGVWLLLGRLRHDHAPQPTIARLGVRNAARQAVRSILTVGLLASASFLIVAVESFHKNTDRQFHDKSGGSGGFAFFAEGSLPVFEDLNVTEVRKDHELTTPELRRAEFYACRVQPGDDASCLNLYKPLKPRVMGVPKKFIELGRFHFAGSAAKSEADKANPWLLLKQDADGAIPAIIDANTAQWILKVQLGDSVVIHNDRREPVKLRIVGLLHESIFQSELLVSEANFLKLFPRQEGASFFLIDVNETDTDKRKVIETQLTKGLDNFGLDVQTTASRLEGYLAVENMYLATFQALGGLGLVLGAVGLAIVLLRGVWERRAELALLLALGFRPGQLAWLVLVENVLLLVLGLIAGMLSALLAVGPHLVGAGATVLWLRIAGLLALVLVVGLAAAALAIWSTLRTPVLTALRRE